MSLVVIPNVSEGRQESAIKALAATVRERGGAVLDTHSDAAHHRTVFTVEGDSESLVRAMEALAVASAIAVDLTTHDGLHPRVGALDVCPFVPTAGEDLTEAAAAARSAGELIAAAGIPVYLYGAASSVSRDLPALRRGGLAGLIDRAAGGDAPDLGPSTIDPRVGVVCVGARLPLIAFNVWIKGSTEEANTIARQIRAPEGGLPGVRAIGLGMGDGQAQVSMNLTDPKETSMEDALAAVEAAAGSERVTGTEIIGLPPERFMPAPDAKVARLLITPGHSLESKLQNL